MNIALRKSFVEIQELIASPPPLLRSTLVLDRYHFQYQHHHHQQQHQSKSICDCEQQNRIHQDSDEQCSRRDGCCFDPMSNIESKDHCLLLNEYDNLRIGSSRSCRLCRDDLDCQFDSCNSNYHHHHHHHCHHRNEKETRFKRTSKKSFKCLNRDRNIMENRSEINQTNRINRSRSSVTVTTATSNQTMATRKSSSSRKLRNFQTKNHYDLDFEPIEKSCYQELQHRSSSSRSKSRSHHNDHHCTSQSQSNRFETKSEPLVRPRLETLPLKPLRKGEHYFMDLDGRIHKGLIDWRAAEAGNRRRDQKQQKINSKKNFCNNLFLSLFFKKKIL